MPRQQAVGAPGLVMAFDVPPLLEPGFSRARPIHPVGAQSAGLASRAVKSRMSGRDSRRPTVSITSSARPVGKPAYSAQRRNFAATSSSVMGFALLPLP